MKNTPAYCDRRWTPLAAALPAETAVICPDKLPCFLDQRFASDVHRRSRDGVRLLQRL